MGLDNDVYEDAEIFKPERFIEHDGMLRKTFLPQQVFGFGRR